MKRYMIILVLVALVALMGCSQKAVTQPDSDKQAGQKDSGQTGTAGDRGKDQRGSTVDSRDISSKTTQEKEGMFEDVYFDYDKYDVKDSYKPLMKSIAAYMSKNPAVRLSIEGHCDERGTNEYNLALGDRRAKATKDLLVSLGVPSAKIDLISYGEERPACKEQTEACWAKNRRAHFVVLSK